MIYGSPWTRYSTAIFLLVCGVYVVTKAFDIITGRAAKEEGKNKNPVVRGIEWLAFGAACIVMVIALLCILVCMLFGGIYFVYTDELPLTYGVLITIFFWGIILCVVLEDRITTFNATRRLRRRLAQFQGQRLPADRQKRLRKNVPHYVRLPDELKPKLEEQMLMFLDQVEFITKRTLKCTEEMRDMVAAEACLLIVNRSVLDYRHFKTVEI